MILKKQLLFQRGRQMSTTKVPLKPEIRNRLIKTLKYLNFDSVAIFKYTRNISLLSIRNVVFKIHTFVDENNPNRYNLHITALGDSVIIVWYDNLKRFKTGYTKELKEFINRQFTKIKNISKNFEDYRFMVFDVGTYSFTCYDYCYATEHKNVKKVAVGIPDELYKYIYKVKDFLLSIRGAKHKQKEAIKQLYNIALEYINLYNKHVLNKLLDPIIEYVDQNADEKTVLIIPVTNYISPLKYNLAYVFTENHGIINKWLDDWKIFKDKIFSQLDEYLINNVLYHFSETIKSSDKLRQLMRFRINEYNTSNYLFDKYRITEHSIYKAKQYYVNINGQTKIIDKDVCSSLTMLYRFLKAGEGDVDKFESDFFIAGEFIPYAIKDTNVFVISM